MSGIVNRSFTCLLLAAFFDMAASAQQPPVILISIDTLRADHLSSYGYTQLRTPNIDSFADHGTLFAQADCQIPLTLPSHASLFTSTYPFWNQVEENAEPVPSGAVTLAATLHSHGYATAAFIGSVFLERRMGLASGFDVYDSPFNIETFSPASGAKNERRDGALVLRAARQWLGENNTRPAFAFVHLYDLHKPWPVSYDEQLRYLDRILGSFRQSLIETGLWDRALVVLLSDHGEGLGDHGETSHGYFIYESTLHVPLMIHWPSSSPIQPSRKEEPAGLIDVAPTILDFLHIPIPASFQGTSLLGTHIPVFAESVHAHDAFGWAPLRSLRSGPWKYIEAPRPELYNVEKDPRELNNLYGKEPAKANDLRSQLAKLMSRYVPKQAVANQTISSSARALLDSLGYLAPGPRTSLTGRAPDPKDRIQEFRLYEEAWVEIFYQRFDQGIAKLIQLLTADPANLLARRDLAGAYAQKKDYPQARIAYQKVVTAAPGDYVAQYEFGLTLEHLNLWKEAKEHLEAACRIDPDAQECRRELDIVLKKLE
jgi:tetratricopeptide (TPR) repeat protein